jgi:hypothetical protein
MVLKECRIKWEEEEGGNKRSTLIALALFEAHCVLQRMKLILLLRFLNSFPFIELDKFYPLKTEEETVKIRV